VLVSQVNLGITLDDVHKMYVTEVVFLIIGGGYAKLKERQGSKELLDPGTASVMSQDGADEGLMAESKVVQSSATPGRQSVGLLSGPARLVKRAMATADRYKEFVDADVDSEAAPITTSDCDANRQSDECSDADDSKLSRRLDFQHTDLDDADRHSTNIPPAAAVTTVTATITTHQPVLQSRKVTVGDGHVVRQRPAKPDLSAHTSSVNPFSLGKIMPPLSCSTTSSAAASSASSCSNNVDVFGAAPFRRKAFGPEESKSESADNIGELDVFANVPFVRQQERVAKAASSVSPPATSSKVASVPNPALGSDGGTYSAFAPVESYNTSGVYVTSSATFQHNSNAPMSTSFVPTECVSGGGQMSVGTLSSDVPPYSVEMQETSDYVHDSGPLLASPPLSVVGKSSHPLWPEPASGECLDPVSYGSKIPAYPVVPSDANQSTHEEAQATEESHGTGSLKRGWLAKLRNDKESPTTAVANLGFSDDPDAIALSSTLPSASDLSFHKDTLDTVAEPKSPMMVDESNLLLPSVEGSHTLPKVGVKKHASHQHRAPPMPPETDSFSLSKKGIALL